MIPIETCPLCRSRHSERYYDHGAPGRIRVLNRICAECGLIFQSPRLDAAEMARYYADYMGQTQPDIADIPLSFEAHIEGISRLRLRHLQPFLRDGMRVLDIGCSFGAMLATLRDQSGVRLDLVGVNPEASLARFGQQRYGLDIRIGMFEAMTFASGSFDLVILDNVIEHFDDPSSSIAEISRLLAPDGLLLVVTNNARQPHGFYWQNFFLDRTVTFTPETLTALLGLYGLTVSLMDNAGHVTHHGYHYPYTTCIARKDGLPTALDHVGLARHAREMRRFPAAYAHRNYQCNGLAKHLYEWTLSPHGWTPALARQIVALGGRMGWDLTFQLPSHTLPPEDLRRHWVFAAFCDSYDDGAKALALSRATGMNADFHLFRRDDQGEGYILAMTPGPNRLRRFTDAAQALDWLLRDGRPPDLIIATRLRQAAPLDAGLAQDVIAFIRGSDRQRVLAARDDFTLFASRSAEADAFPPLLDGRLT